MIVSVCMASYNGSKYIGHQISSILDSQLVDELLISDDGSSDNTVQIIEKIREKDNRVKLLKGPGKGLIRNFEYLLEKAAGDYIFLSDQDDVWEEEKVEIILGLLKNYHCVVSDCYIANDSLELLNDSYYSIRAPKSGVINNLFKNSYLGCCMAFRREILQRCLPFPQNIPMHDWWIGLISEQFYDLVFIPEKLIKYRRHVSSNSDTAGPSSSSLIKKIIWRILIAHQLILRIRSSVE